jgi:uncharacterized protein YcbK (DUF882 family)
VQLSPHFSLEEFRCSSGEFVPRELMANLHELVDDVLEPVRQRWGAPIIVVSGYRSPTYNEAIRRVSDERAKQAGLAHGGVAQNSQHLYARAADIRPVHLADVPALKKVVEELLRAGKLPKLGGLGTYPAWLHLDTRATGKPGYPIRWAGEGVGSEPGP